jgi:hypothetical protein
MSIIKDGAKARIVTDKGENATKVKIGKTPFSNRDGKDDISKGRHKISIMESYRDYKGKGGNRQKHTKRSSYDKTYKWPRRIYDPSEIGKLSLSN